MRTVAVIPVSLGSTRVKDKNLLLVDGEPLASYVCRAAVEAGVFDDIYLYSEHEEFRKIAEINGVSFLKRHKNRGGSECLMSNSSLSCKGKRCQVHDHFLANFCNIIDSDYFVQIHSTSPLISSETIRGFVSNLYECETLIGVENLQKEAFFEGDAINFMPNKKVPTQSLKPISSICWAMTGWKTIPFVNRYEASTKEGGDSSVTFGGVSSLFEIPTKEALDVDTMDELFIVEACLSHKKRAGSVGTQYLDLDSFIGIDRDVKKLIEEDGSPMIESACNRRKVSLSELKDMASGENCSIPVVWTDNDQVFFIQQSKGEGCRYHYHPTKTEFWIIMQGEFEFCIEGEDSFVAKAGDIVSIPHGKPHKMTCVSDEPGIRIACGENNFSHIYLEEDDNDKL
jgi:CMP-N-acetylneuraminic acid synthetase/mannose-6-phosphate isomerase-like protein (cupin superfamily)